MKPRPVHLGMLALTLSLLIGMIWMIIRRQGPIRMLLFAVALVSQWGFLLSTGQGIGAMSRIASHSVHMPLFREHFRTSDGRRTNAHTAV